MQLCTSGSKMDAGGRGVATAERSLRTEVQPVHHIKASAFDRWWFIPVLPTFFSPVIVEVMRSSIR